MLLGEGPEKTRTGRRGHGAGARCRVPGFCTVIAPSQRVLGQVLGVGGGGAELPQGDSGRVEENQEQEPSLHSGQGDTGCTQDLTSAVPDSPHRAQGLILAQPQGQQPRSQQAQGWQGLLRQGQDWGDHP